MKTLEQINALLEVLDSDNASLIDELQKRKADIEKPKGGIYVPKLGEEYWFLSENSARNYRNEECSVDKATIASQLVYRTREEAERADRKRMAEVHYIRLIAEANDGWWPDWEDGTQMKWLVLCDHEDNEIRYTSYSVIQLKDLCYYAKSREAAKWAVEQLTEEEMELIFKS